jgi:GMP synthase (glutamine-hydrolysing)
VVRVLAVNNYPKEERFARLVRGLEEAGAEVSSLGWAEASAHSFPAYDGVVLSGSPDMMSNPRTRSKFSAEMEATVDSKAPVLGVCFGHQLIATAFGSRVVKDSRPVLRMVETRVLADDPLFAGLSNSLTLLESRHEVVESLPAGFLLLASSATSRVAAMRHSRRPLYGVQSHPERYTLGHPDGRRLLGNFVATLK